MRQTIQVAPVVAGTSGHSKARQADPAIRTDGVYVVFTSLDETLAALRATAGFSAALGVPVTLVHFREVPYELPVDGPGGVSPIETDAFMRRLRTEGLAPRVHVCLCRDYRRAIPMVFKPNSLIVVAGRRGWWPTQSKRWRRALEDQGHFVVFVNTSKPNVFGARQSSSAAA